MRELKNCEKLFISMITFDVLEGLAYLIAHRVSFKLMILAFIAVRIYNLGYKDGSIDSDEFDELDIKIVLLMALIMILGVVIGILIMFRNPCIAVLYIVGTIVDKWLKKIIPRRFFSK